MGTRVIVEQLLALWVTGLDFTDDEVILAKSLEVLVKALQTLH